MWLEHLLFGAETDAVLRGWYELCGLVLEEVSLFSYTAAAAGRAAMKIIDNIGKDNEVKQHERSEK